MASYLVRFQVEPGPSDKLPLAWALLEAAEEHGLLWVIQLGDQVGRLPPGAVWGDFADHTAALAAFDGAAATVSELFGIDVQVVRRLVVLTDADVPAATSRKAVNPGCRGDGRFQTSLLHQLYDPPGPPPAADRIEAAAKD